MKNLLLVCMVLVMSLMLPCPQSAHAQDVESFVQDFYKWYLKTSLQEGGDPVFDEGIFKYVCKCTAKRVQFDYERAVIDADYYLKGQDVGKEQLEELTVGSSIAINDSLGLVPVSMMRTSAPHIVVYVEKTKGEMCISKVEDSPGPNFRALVY